ncbi:LysR family transcriptional regulator [Uliginosibacterium sp. 31-16]|uniref:LysR family transcriptional regulator n=1 Tax=Uliginosibacterium sp. 31-16 TaxID=3068315 RepID=UPI00273F49B2|nr:LysR family transcriptional regulator [Uliginosibacterium sp. 31-16]MDP5239373.1 LysR family transcriptional regulator [Uliginosibacterium sp. 31-16]
MSIEHRHIEIFRAVIQAGSVTGAAALLYTSQPTVSRELARFETLLGFALFDRVRGRLKPTARALALHEEVQRSYIGLERILATASGLREFAAASLAIVCVPAFAQALLPGVCRRFRAQHASVGLAITPAESPWLEEWLSAQRFDLGLTEQDSAPPGTTLEVLLEADEVCVLPASHPLTAKPVLMPQDFAGQPFISLAPGDPYRVQLDAVFHEHGVARQQLLETQTAASVCALVREGLGLAIVNPLTALEYAAHAESGLALRRFGVSIPFRVSAVRPAYRPSTPLSDAFLTALRAEATALRQRLGDQ